MSRKPSGGCTSSKSTGTRIPRAFPSSASSITQCEFKEASDHATSTHRACANAAPMNLIARSLQAESCGPRTSTNLADCQCLGQSFRSLEVLAGIADEDVAHAPGCSSARFVMPIYRGERDLRASLPAPRPAIHDNTIRRSPPCEAGKQAHGHPRTAPGLSVNRPVPGHGHLAARADWARRKPTLLFLLSGLFLLRFAERRFLGLLFQEPPRITRWPSHGPLPL